MLRQTHTYAVLEIPTSAWDEIVKRLFDAGVGDHYVDQSEGLIVFGTVALAPERQSKEFQRVEGHAPFPKDYVVCHVCGTQDADAHYAGCEWLKKYTSKPAEKS